MIFVLTRNARKASPITIDRQFHCRCTLKCTISQLKIAVNYALVKEKTEKKTIPHRFVRKQIS